MRFVSKKKNYIDHSLLHLVSVKLLRSQKIGWYVGAVGVHLVAIHTPSLARAEQRQWQIARGARNPSSSAECSRGGGQTLLFSLRMICPSVSATRSDTHRRTYATDRDSLRHANSVRERWSNNPSLTLASPSPFAPLFLAPPMEKFVQLSSRGRTWRNYPAAKSAPPTRASHVCERASRTTCPCPPHGRETI